MAFAPCSLARTALGPLQYDKTSPAAPAIASTSVKGVAYPSLINVPSQPTDVRPVTAWNRNIFDTLNARRQMEGFVVAYPQSLYGAEAYAQDGQALGAPPLTEAEAAAMSEQSIAFAKEGKARATPPSPAP